MDILDFDVLGFLYHLISTVLSPIMSLIIGILPDGDSQVFAYIDSIANLGGDMTFNVFYFVNWGPVGLCFGVLVTTALIVAIVKFVKYAVEAIPVVE